MQKKDLITSLSHYNTFNFIHWRVCISDGTCSYVLDTDPAYESIVESWDNPQDEDDFVDFIMEVGADYFCMDRIMEGKQDFEDLKADHTLDDGTVEDFDAFSFGFGDEYQDYESYYLEDMFDQMIQIRLVSQFAKDRFFRITIAMQNQNINTYDHPFDEYHEYILNRFGAWGRAQLDYDILVNGDRQFHTITLGSHQNFLGYDIEALNSMVDEYVSQNIGDGVAVDIEYNTNDDGILEAHFEYEN